MNAFLHCLPAPGEGLRNSWTAGGISQLLYSDVCAPGAKTTGMSTTEDSRGILSLAASDNKAFVGIGMLDYNNYAEGMCMAL